MSQPANPLAASVSSANLPWMRLSTAANGARGLSNPELVLAEAIALEKALTFVKAAARAEIASRKREKRDAEKQAAKDAVFAEANAEELARRRAEQARFEGMSGNTRAYAAEGLAIMAKAAAA